MVERRMRGQRMRDDQADAVRRVAERDGVPWSTAMIRLAMWAVPRMPKGWHPGEEEK